MNQAAINPWPGRGLALLAALAALWAVMVVHA